MKWYDVAALAIAVVGATVSGMEGNWGAMLWAIAAGTWVINASIRGR